MAWHDDIYSLFIIGFPGPTFPRTGAIGQTLREKPVGGVILFNRCLHDPSYGGNIVSPDQLQELTQTLQHEACFPLLICVDQEGGAVQRLSRVNGFSETTAAAELAEMPDPLGHTRDAAEHVAATLVQAGINVNFAPVADLNSNRHNPIIGALGRSFSPYPEPVIDHCATWIEAHRRFGVLSCLKHFPGHGSSSADSHLGFVDITDTWQEWELAPYRSLIDRGLADLVMTGHLVHRDLDRDYPATLSPAIIQGLLRQQLGFTGAVVSDDLQMRAIGSYYGFTEAVCRALAAGVDLLVIGNNLEYDPDVLSRAHAAVMTGLKTGLITEEQLAEAIRRVKNLKQSITSRDQ